MGVKYAPEAAVLSAKPKAASKEAYTYDRLHSSDEQS